MFQEAIKRFLKLLAKGKKSIIFFFKFFASRCVPLNNNGKISLL